MKEIREHRAKNPIPESKMMENVLFWEKTGLPEITKQSDKTGNIDILAGGLSIDLYKGDGSNAIAAGSTIKLLTERGITPEYWLTLDPNEQVYRFLKDLSRDTKSIISVTSDPSIYEHINKETAVIYYPMCMVYRPEKRKVLNGTTVGITAIPIAMMLGFKNITAYGLDSCLIDGQYNSGYYSSDRHMEVFDIECNGRKFSCNRQNLMQAIDFKNFCTLFGGCFNINFAGNGLLACMARGK